jgi:hypothetical protein
VSHRHLTFLTLLIPTIPLYILFSISN